jgi:hypothetical protein
MVTKHHPRSPVANLQTEARMGEQMIDHVAHNDMPHEHWEKHGAPNITRMRPSR